MDYQNTTPSKDIIEKLVGGFHLLKEEIKIVKPDVVIFLTSWRYDDKIREVFKGVEFDVLEKRKLSQLSHKDLPSLTFRTYHPNYLQRSGHFNRILKELEKLCT